MCKVENMEKRKVGTMFIPSEMKYDTNAFVINDYEIEK